MSIATTAPAPNMAQEYQKRVADLVKLGKGTIGGDGKIVGPLDFTNQDPKVMELVSKDVQLIRDTVFGRQQSFLAQKACKREAWESLQKYDDKIKLLGGDDEDLRNASNALATQLLAKGHELTAKAKSMEAFLANVDTILAAVTDLPPARRCSRVTSMLSCVVQ